MGKAAKYTPGDMTQRGGRERRRHPRRRFTSELACTEFSTAGVPVRGRKTLQGQVQNISAGGLGARGSCSLGKSSLVRCEVRLPGSSVRIPTLMQVRWTRETPGANKRRFGLQFLL